MIYCLLLSLDFLVKNLCDGLSGGVFARVCEGRIWLKKRAIQRGARDKRSTCDMILGVGPF